MDFKNRRIVIANIAWATLIFILLVMPADQNLSKRWMPEYTDKIVHFILFGGMTLLLVRMQEHFLKVKKAYIYFIAFIITVIFGTAMEFIQERYFSRSCERYDILADALGAIAACFFYPFIKAVIHKIKTFIYNRN